jgi:hypothetical protein
MRFLNSFRGGWAIRRGRRVIITCYLGIYDYKIDEGICRRARIIGAGKGGGCARATLSDPEMQRL